MKKTILTILTCSFMIFGLTGCVTFQNEAKIITNSGNNTNLTYSDLMKEYYENEDKFNKEYIGADIEVIGSVKQVRNATIIGYGSCYAGTKQIILEDGWVVAFDKDADVDLSDLKKGDKIKVNSKIYDVLPFVDSIQSDFKEGEDYDVIFLTDAGNEKCHIGSNSKIELIN